MVCVRPLTAHQSRLGGDLTWDKSDPSVAVLIARLASELPCYEPKGAPMRVGAAVAPRPAARRLTADVDGASQPGP